MTQLPTFVTIAGALLIWSQPIGAGGAPQPPTAPAASTPKPKIHAFIIGVPSWRLVDYSTSRLGPRIQSTCDELATFLTNAYGTSVEIHPDAKIRCTKSGTTFAAIRSQLAAELPRVARGTISLVFMMSHGERVERPGAFVSEDLRFLTSDATDQNKDVRSIEINRDLWPWLRSVTRGSTVLVFVDTCHAGAASQVPLKLDSVFMTAAGMRLGLVLSSLRSEATYATAFTRSLIGLWQQSPCPISEKVPLEKWLHDEIERVAGKLDQGEGFPERAIDFRGGYCMGSLHPKSGLLMLYKGDIGPVEWTIARAGGEKVPGEFSPADVAFTFRLIPPGKYHITATALDSHERRSFDADVDETSAMSVFWDFPKSGAAAVAALRTWAEMADDRGLPRSEVARIRRSASVLEASLLKGGFVGADALTAALQDSGQLSMGKSLLAQASRSPGSSPVPLPALAPLVIGKTDHSVVVRGVDGTVHEYSVAAGQPFGLSDGTKISLSDLKIGTALPSKARPTSKAIAVKTTTIKDGEIIKATGSKIVTMEADGLHTYIVPKGFTLMVEGKEVAAVDLSAGMKVSGTVVTKSTTRIE